MRRVLTVLPSPISRFQFTHPVWGATERLPRDKLNRRGFNSRTPCGVRLVECSPCLVHRVVSIHAPRVGCDSRAFVDLTYRDTVSIHAPRVGCDLCIFVSSSALVLVSIHAPRVGCDSVHGHQAAQHQSFNSRTPCGVRPRSRLILMGAGAVSIHAPRVGCDKMFFLRFTREMMFQFTHPVWGATPHFSALGYQEIVSIHAPRVGCDNGIN